MFNPGSISVLISLVLGFGLAIPSNTLIVIVNLESIRKKGKLSPSDVIFMAKGIVNILLQGFMAFQGVTYVTSSVLLYSREGYAFVILSIYFLTYFSFWLTLWLSVYYCTTITNLSYRFFIWLKRIVSNFLSQVLFLTALAIFPVSFLNIWVFNDESQIQSTKNSTEASIIRVLYNGNYPYFVPVTFLGCILPFCLSLLCLLLTFSFLVRHVWRVKNNDSGSSRPNLQAHVTALRTIFFLLLMFTSFSISQVLIFIITSQETVIQTVSWNLQLLSPLVEAAVIFQASNKLKRIILRRFWTRSWRNSET
ncbi:PREDICTED: taste receptor type 2 member 8-like [Nanorana parkeri]|uniref:taste receptor type 2 member 8-like n=1 Tax=Nanorana parkeri TaxID=125878 RepID=UPI0008540494|nr:PREDICTED: taste receptor type 2 member 8-like [Nanorana parkeri]